MDRLINFSNKVINKAIHTAITLVIILLAGCDAGKLNDSPNPKAHIYNFKISVVDQQGNNQVDNVKLDEHFSYFMPEIFKVFVKTSEYQLTVSDDNVTQGDGFTKFAHDSYHDGSKTVNYLTVYTHVKDLKPQREIQYTLTFPNLLGNNQPHTIVTQWTNQDWHSCEALTFDGEVITPVNDIYTIVTDR
jgi:hypothetical protein